MSEGFNKVILIGYVADKNNPELRYTQSGRPVLNARIATTERYKDRDGELQERVDFFSIVIWGNRARGLGTIRDDGSPILSKGTRFMVEGRLQTRQWEDKQGQKRSTVEIVAQRILLLSSKGRQVEGSPAYEAGEDEEGEMPEDVAKAVNEASFSG